MTNVTFRNLNEKVINELRVEAAKLKINLGEAVTEAIKLWLHTKKRKINIYSMQKDPLWLSINEPFDVGYETSSKTIDKELYGE